MIRVRDLTDCSQGIVSNVVPRKPILFLLCLDCGEHYSAHRGDYFLRSPASILDCCGRPMVRVIEHTTVEEV